MSRHLRLFGGYFSYRAMHLLRGVGASAKMPVAKIITLTGYHALHIIILRMGQSEGGKTEWR